jgi:hypothetical protein
MRTAAGNLRSRRLLTVCTVCNRADPQKPVQTYRPDGPDKPEFAVRNQGTPRCVRQLSAQATRVCESCWTRPVRSRSMGLA